MQKLMVFVRRKPGLSPEAFRDHYEATHAPLALAHMPGLVRHVPNYPKAMPGQPEPQYDCVTEMWFADLEALGKSMAWMRSDAAKVIADDEQLFMDRASMTAFLVDETPSN